MLLSIITAALSGMFMTFQGTFNSVLLKKIGITEMSLIVHLTGFVLSLVLVLFCGSFLKFHSITSVPWYSLLGGILSVAIILGVAFTISRIGAALGISVILIAQLTTALILDHFGWFTLERIPATWIRILGTALMIVGARLLLNR